MPGIAKFAIELFVGVLFDALYFCALFPIIYKFVWRFGKWQGRRIIWYRVILLGLCNGIKGYLVYMSVWPGPVVALDLLIYFTLNIIAAIWATESDDDYRKRKKRIRELINKIKDFKIYGWNPGPQIT